MKTSNRHYSNQDQFCLSLDRALRALIGKPESLGRPYPAKQMLEPDLTGQERKHSAGLMRVNHAGEVCAQALYCGQSLITRNPQLKQQMLNAAAEEGDHLNWCQMRLSELNSHTSYLNPFWYAGSFIMGMIAGIVGDKWSLGFLAETERQVVNHLESHLHVLSSSADIKSAAVIQQMQQDEAHHQAEALQAGGIELPRFIQKLMNLTSKLMVKTAFWI